MIDIIYHDGASAAPDQAGQSGGFAQADGNGEIHCYSWLDGVSAMLMRLEMKSYTELRTQKGLLELNFCANGRFETRFSLRDHVLLKPGDMAISCYDGVHGSRSESHFPLGYYEGICLEVDPERARRWIERNAPAFRVDFSALQQNLLGDKWYRCSQAGPRCEHVFRELYESAAYLDPAFLRLKVLELLMLLSSIPRGAGTDAYCSARQAELIRHIRDHLLTDREGLYLAFPAGGGARDVRIAPAEAVQANLRCAGLSLHQGIPARAGGGRARAQRKARDGDRAGCGL